MEETTIGVTPIDGNTEIFAEAKGQEKPHFSFNLCHKDVRFGELQLKHWWMDTRTIYPVGNKKAIQYSPLVDFWWKCCLQDSEPITLDACESLILAKILPNSRAIGSRKVFLDSKIGTRNRSPLRQYRKQTNELLDASKEKELTIFEFYEKVRDIIGPPEYSQDLWDNFNQLKCELFDKAVAAIQRGNVSEGISLATEKWENWMKSIGRRRRNPTQKTIIDIFSYEARTAIHQCYSSLWEKIVEWLYQQSNNDRNTHIFHHLWHQDINWPSNEFDDQNFHLLHGHIFGLHPASGDFIETNTGQKLLGDWIAATDMNWRTGGNPEIPEMRRLLHGLSIAFYCYQDRHAERKDLSGEHTQRLTDKTEDDYAFKNHENGERS